MPASSAMVSSSVVTAPLVLLVAATELDAWLVV
jgi:hypothetical protein